ncbi:dual specificity protein phosphatase family protein [Halobacterium jilantaiense]|uniref:Dual specificity phosphatase 12 n=1 Tax=Halobacterium jilantaiense TaxID=355548 RepID=A0A1I0MY21_9EURY|nr:dual specificity protein phosphatase family protein [Halobacterium jilantaiense]SEV93383.1 dual specificity phosphatase 12 [Halobacterium jilantaiense]
MSDDSTPDGDDPRAELFVRPFGYVNDTPVVRRLGDRNCFLGNATAASPDCERTFEHVLSLTETPQPATTHHRPLTDDANNDWAAFAAAVDTARRLLARDGSLLVHCEAGVSRSSAVAAAALAVAESRPFVDALHEVQDARPHAVPHPALHELGVEYVAAQQ